MTRSFALALTVVLTGCAATQPPPLSSSNPASPEAREGGTPPPPRLHGDELIQKANERLTGNAPVQPQYQPAEMGNMPGMQHEGTIMNGEQKPGKSYWTCVIHPQIKQDKPGKCPICRMTLVEKKGGP
jgi:heavy metal-binding protein